MLYTWVDLEMHLIVVEHGLPEAGGICVSSVGDGDE